MAYRLYYGNKYNGEKLGSEEDFEKCQKWEEVLFYIMWSRKTTGDEIGNDARHVDIDRRAYNGGRTTRAKVSIMTYAFKKKLASVATMQ